MTRSTLVQNARTNMNASKKLRPEFELVGKTSVVGAMDRETKKAAAKVVMSTDKETL